MKTPHLLLWFTRRTVTGEYLERGRRSNYLRHGVQNKLSETFVVVITWYNFTVGETCFALLPIQRRPARKEPRKDITRRRGGPCTNLCRNFMLSSATPSFACGCSLKKKKKSYVDEEKLCWNRELPGEGEVGGREKKCDILTIPSLSVCDIRRIRLKMALDAFYRRSIELYRTRFDAAWNHHPPRSSIIKPWQDEMECRFDIPSKCENYTLWQNCVRSTGRNESADVRDISYMYI